MEREHKTIMSNTTENLLNRRDKKQLLDFCKGVFPVVKIRLKNSESKSGKIGWNIHQRYKKAGGNLEIFNNFSLKFAGIPWIIGEQLNTDFPGEGKIILKKFLQSSLSIGQSGLNDMNVYFGADLLSDRFIFEYYKTEKNLYLNNNKNKQLEEVN